MKYARESIPIVLPLLGIAVFLAFVKEPLGALAVVLLALALLLFFRIPRRASNASAGSVLSAANGRVTQIDEIEEPEIGPGNWKRIVTFLSVFNVHVQRSPVSGEIVARKRRSGKKVAAFRVDADRINESLLTVIKTDGGELVGFRQITGLVARRIVGYGEVGDRIERGQLIGLIKFGSRVDLLLPAETYELNAQVGNRLTEGMTIVAERTDSNA